MTDWSNSRSSSGNWGAASGGRRGGGWRGRGSGWEGPPDKFMRPDDSAAGSSGSQVRRCPYADLVPPLEDQAVGEMVSQNISQIWESFKDIVGVRKAVLEAYERTGNPYSMALFLMVRCKDFLVAPSNGPSLSLTVIQGLEKYVENSSNTALVDTRIQLAALRLASKQRRNKELESLVLKVYRIKEIEKEVIEFIRGFVKNNDFEEACQLAATARLECFDIGEFLTPMFFQDKIPAIEDYLVYSKTMQDKLTTFVDGFLYHGAQVDVNIDRYITENNIRVTPKQRSRWGEKSLKKLIKKWINKFGNPSAAPNVQQSVSCGQIKFLVGQRYESECLAEANFLELVADCLRSDTTATAAEYAFRSILQYGDTGAAVKLVSEHNIDISSTPEYIRTIVERGVESQASQQSQPRPSVECWEEENWETGETTMRQVVRVSPTEIPSESVLETAAKAACSYALPIPVTNIVLVSNPTDIAQFCAYIDNRLQREDILESGFDCEWKSIRPECASLLQISFTGAVFLIDLFSLRNQVSCQTQFDILTQVYFSNPKILKLGYDYGNDVLMLAKVHKTWVKLRLLMKNTIDLRILRTKIAQKIPDVFEGTSDSGEVKDGLSDFILQCLGKTLSKDEQISDWERRPLRESQIIYAAADCYCLLDAYLSLKNTDSVKAFGILEILRY